MLDKIRIVLVNTSHPGNIGATARAMKTMGLSQLFLVSPKFFPHPKAIEMSSHADDILDQARVVSSLAEALDNCSLAIGTSARSRTIDLPLLDPRNSAKKLLTELDTTSMSHVAIVFGREDSGLTNEELLHCHYHVNIPSNPEYSSLNLAAAVQILCYELRVFFLEHFSATKKPSETNLVSSDPKATIDEIEQFYEHLETLLIQKEFLKSSTLMPKIRRIFNRIQLEKTEINILRGIVTAAQKTSPSKKTLC